MNDEKLNVAGRLILRRTIKIRILQKEIDDIIRLTEHDHVIGCRANTCDGPCGCPEYAGLNRKV